MTSIKKLIKTKDRDAFTKKGLNEIKKGLEDIKAGRIISIEKVAKDFRIKLRNR